MSLNMHSLCGSWMGSANGLSASPSDYSLTSDRSSVSSDPSFASTYSHPSPFTDPLCAPLVLPSTNNNPSLAQLSVPFQPRLTSFHQSATSQISDLSGLVPPTPFSQPATPRSAGYAQALLPCLTCVSVRSPCNGARPCERCFRLGNQLDCRDFRGPNNSEVSLPPSAQTGLLFSNLSSQSTFSTPSALPLPGVSSHNRTNSGSLSVSSGHLSTSFSPLPAPNSLAIASSASTNASLAQPLSGSGPAPDSGINAVSPRSQTSLPISSVANRALSNTPVRDSSSPQSPQSDGSDSVQVSLPQAKAEVMRVYNDSYYEVLHKIHRKAADPNLRDPHLLATMAHLVHTLSGISLQYEQALLECSKGCEVTEVQSESVSPTRNQPSPAHSVADPAVPTASSWHAKPLASDEEYGPLSSMSQSTRGPPAPPAGSVASIGFSENFPSSAQIPRPIRLHRSQSLLLFLKAYLSPELYSDFSQSPTDKVISLPQLQLPSVAAASEIRVYAIINCWRSMKNVRAVIQRFFAGPSPVDMETNLQAERFRCHGLPFGVIVLPLYPRGFVRYPPWCNDRLAAMLKYEPSRLLQVMSTRRSFFSLYHPDSMTAGHVLPIAALAAGKTRFSLRMNYNRSDGSTLQSITSVMMRYFDAMPMYAVMFIQEIPSRIQ